MEFTGKLILVGDVEEFKNNFTKQNIVVETTDKYPQKIQVEFIKDNIDHLHGLILNDEITVHFNLKGREYNGKYYTSIEGWRVVKKAVKEKPDDIPSDVTTFTVDNDDLPF
jgi:hypothetical protein